MKLNSNSLIKFCYLLLLVFCIWQPAYAIDPPPLDPKNPKDQEKEKEKPKTNDETSDDRKKSTTTTNAATDTFFKDATYDKFESLEKEDSDTFKPFDESYLEN